MKLREVVSIVDYFLLGQFLAQQWTDLRYRRIIRMYCQLIPFPLQFHRHCRSVQEPYAKAKRLAISSFSQFFKYFSFGFSLFHSFTFRSLRLVRYSFGYFVDTQRQHERIHESESDRTSTSHLFAFALHTSLRVYIVYTWVLCTFMWAKEKS